MCFENYCNVTAYKKPVVDALLIDGAAVINMLKPRESRTFADYAEHVFLPYLQILLSHVRRFDVIWDRYIQNSLKEGARQTTNDAGQELFTHKGRSNDSIPPTSAALYQHT
jgi:hypothetical protein